MSPTTRARETGRRDQLLLEAARAALRGELALPPARVSRAAALLARTALEGIVDERLTHLGPGLSECSMRVRLICLRTLVDADEGAKAAWAYGGLSSACHHHAYELAPTATEVEYLIDAVAGLGRSD